MYDNYQSLVMLACAVPVVLLVGSAIVILAWGLWREQKIEQISTRNL